MFQLIIVGGGPAGAGSAVYSARKQIKTLLITENFNGQSSVSDSIENWIGTKVVSGMKLSKMLEEHVRAYAGDFVKIETGKKVVSVSKSEENGKNVFIVKDSAGNEYKTQSVLITVGSKRRKLEVPGAEQFENKGITYCATCDGPLFKDKDVVVIGGGNAGFETASQLLSYCKSVTLLHHRKEFKADPVNVEIVSKHPKAKIITNASTTEIYGDKFVEGLKYKDVESGEIFDLKAQGIFVEIGAVPNTEIINGLVELNEYKAVKIDPWNQKTSLKGVWAAGDCTNALYHQNNIATGDAIKALEDIYYWLQRQS